MLLPDGWHGETKGDLLETIEDKTRMPYHGLFPLF